ncbi:MAG: hypothetical protein ACNI22_04605 [Halarcobacter sp.]
MSILSSFVKEFNDTFNKAKEIEYEEGLVGDIKKVRDKLLDP